MSAEPLRVRTRAIADPGDLLSLVPRPEGLAWVRRGGGLVGWGIAHRVELRAGDPLDHAAEVVADLGAGAEVSNDVEELGTGLVAFVSVTFDVDRPGSVLVVPRMLLGRRGGRAWRTTVGEVMDEPVGHVQAVPAPGRMRYAGSQVSELRWLDAVATATRRIAQGELDKVVLARDLQVWSESPLDARALTRRLAEVFPDCYTFSCDGLVGATPELLVRREGARVTSLVLAGTARRGADRESDAAIGAALLGSGKDLDEHRHAVDSVRDVLGPRCTGLAVDGPELLRLDNLQHLATHVSGDLADGDTVLDLAASLHPTAAVCGTPTAAALAMIRELEGLDRRRYAGPVGWVGAGGDGELGIALRCAEVEGDRARLYAGAGLVADSLPEAELEETRIKFRAMQAALGDEAARPPARARR